MDRGCHVFLASVVATAERSVPDLAHIPMVGEFPDVFPDEVPGLPPHRELEFAINLAPGTAPISRAPYRMAPLELWELKTQLQESRNSSGRAFPLRALQCSSPGRRTTA